MIFKFLLHVHIVQEAPIHQRHVYGLIKILRTIFEKGHPRNIPFKIGPAVPEKKIFQEFLHVCIVQKAPFHKSHVYEWISILRTIFEKGHTRNIPVKSFQNLARGFGEDDFFKNFFMSK